MVRQNQYCMILLMFMALTVVSAGEETAGVAFDLQGFIDQAIEMKLDPIVVPPGRYRVTPRNRQHLVLKDLKDVRIMAVGVEMICTETTRAVTIENCENLTLKGLVIDYDPLPYTQGRIVKLSADNTVHDIELFDGYPRGDEIQDFKYEIFKADTRTLRFGSYFEFRAVDRQADRIRVIRGGRYHGEQVGDIIAIGTSHAPGGQIPHAVYTTRSRYVVLEDVTLYASNCFGFFETECDKTTYLRCRVDRRGAQDDFKVREDPRIRSLDADAFHSKFATVGPQLIGCTARFQADDCVNICGDYHMVMACDGPNLRILSKGRMNIRPGDPLEVVAYDGQRLPDARAVSVQRSGIATDAEQAFMGRQRMHKPFTEGGLRQIYEVVMDRSVDLSQGSVIAAANRMGNGFKVTQCDFGFNRSRGILIKASHGEVSNNRLEGCVEEAVKVAPEFWWLEAGSSNDVRITGNTIEHCDGMGIAVYAQAGAGGLAPAGAHNRIVIEGNKLRDVGARAIWVTSTRGLILRDNDFGDTAPEIKLEHCEDVVTEKIAVGMDNQPAGRVRTLLDFDWRFHRGAVTQAQAMGFDDTTWRPLDLPHDFGIEDLPGTSSPIDPNALGGVDSGFLSHGTAWYRKTFIVPAESKGRRFDLEFEGVYMNADVWLNGEHLGNHPYGYTSFWYDVTDRLRYGAENVLAVEVKNEGRSSRWYSGSGIYRHVWLTVTEPVHVAHWGTSITTPEITDKRAAVSVKTRVANTTKQDRRVLIKTRVLDQQGLLVAETQTAKQFTAHAEGALAQDLRILSPQRWSPESPVLYTAVTEIFDPADADKPRLLDRVETRFGIRSLDFSVDKGFLLNGRPVLLKGGCMHHGNGPLGTAAYDRAEERRVELMKASGFNAIRCAHNPPSPAFLDACDRLGMLVIDEAFDMWRQEKRPQDYHLFFDDWWQRDIDSMVLRDRNHPCVILWSTGNEIPERGTPEGAATSRTLADYVRKLDPTRPVTSAVNSLNPDKDPYFATLDLAGYNYAVGGDHRQDSLYEQDHKRVPQRIIYCAESYPLDAFGSWMAAVDLPYVIGDFVWTGLDYLGEASIGWLGYMQDKSFYPWTHAFCGDIDICGFKRPQSYYRNVLWQAGQQVSIFVTPPEPSFAQNPKREPWSRWHWHDVVADWNWPGHEGRPLDVTVYCAYERVELFLNDKSLGTKTTNRSTEWTAQWAVPYEPGVLKAVAYDGLTQVATWDLRTAQTPAQIRLTPDRSTIQADGQDLCYVTVEVLDAAGIRHPKTDSLVEFAIEGPGSIRAVGSSNPMGTESFQRPYRRAYQGRCLVVVKSETEKGTLKLTARTRGLKPSTVSIVSE
ncbi:MAG: DUF4982 domain-containing protein [Phycisphaerae bacterium]|nr:DUF4982 domain-containing protein [Phycisphaerae bacterium]